MSDIFDIVALNFLDYTIVRLSLQPVCLQGCATFDAYCSTVVLPVFLVRFILCLIFTTPSPSCTHSHMHAGFSSINFGLFFRCDNYVMRVVALL